MNLALGAEVGFPIVALLCLVVGWSGFGVSVSRGRSALSDGAVRVSLVGFLLPLLWLGAVFLALAAMFAGL